MEIKNIFYWDDENFNENEFIPSYSVSISASGDEMTLSYKCLATYHDKTCTGSVTFSADEYSGTIVDVYNLTSPEGDYVFLEYPARVFLKATTARLERVKVARIVFDDEGGVFIQLTQPCKGVDGYECTPMARNELVSSYLTEASDWFKSFRAKEALKNKFLREVDVADSISYLESQVDVLTRVVISLAAGETPSADLLDLLATADENSVLSIKDTDAISAELKKNKAGFRAKQGAYYAARAALKA